MLVFLDIQHSGGAENGVIIGIAVHSVQTTVCIAEGIQLVGAQIQEGVIAQIKVYGRVAIVTTKSNIADNQMVISHKSGQLSICGVIVAIKGSATVQAGRHHSSVLVIQEIVLFVNLCGCIHLLVEVLHGGVVENFFAIAGYNSLVTLLMIYGRSMVIFIPSRKYP